MAYSLSWRLLAAAVLIAAVKAQMDVPCILDTETSSATLTPGATSAVCNPADTCTGTEGTNERCQQQYTGAAVGCSGDQYADPVISRDDANVALCLPALFECATPGTELSCTITGATLDTACPTMTHILTTYTLADGAGANTQKICQPIPWCDKTTLYFTESVTRCRQTDEFTCDALTRDRAYLDPLPGDGGIYAAEVCDRYADCAAGTDPGAQRGEGCIIEDNTQLDSGSCTEFLDDNVDDNLWQDSFDWNADTDDERLLCKELTVCADWEYESTAPTDTSDRVCTTLATCADGLLLASQGGRSCLSLNADCTGFTFGDTGLELVQSDAMDADDDAAADDYTCKAAEVCENWQFEQTAYDSTATPDQDRVCAAMADCSTDEATGNDFSALGGGACLLYPADPANPDPTSCDAIDGDGSIDTTGGVWWETYDTGDDLVASRTGLVCKELTQCAAHEITTPGAAGADVTCTAATETCTATITQPCVILDPTTENAFCDANPDYFRQSVNAIAYCSLRTVCHEWQYVGNLATVLDTGDYTCTDFAVCNAAQDLDGLAGGGCSNLDDTTTCAVDGVTSTNGDAFWTKYVDSDDEYDDKDAKLCLLATACEDYEYELTPPTELTDRVCERKETCSATQTYDATTASVESCLVQSNDVEACHAFKGTLDNSVSSTTNPLVVEGTLFTLGGEETLVCAVMSDCTENDVAPGTPCAIATVAECTEINAYGTEAATADRPYCTALEQACDPNQYESAKPDATTDRECTEVTEECKTSSSNDFSAYPGAVCKVPGAGDCTGINNDESDDSTGGIWGVVFGGDAYCREHSLCEDWQQVAQAGDATTDTQCEPFPECNGDSVVTCLVPADDGTCPGQGENDNPHYSAASFDNSDFKICYFVDRECAYGAGEAETAIVGVGELCRLDPEFGKNDVDCPVGTHMTTEAFCVPIPFCTGSNSDPVCRQTDEALEPCTSTDGTTHLLTHSYLTETHPLCYTVPDCEELDSTRLSPCNDATVNKDFECIFPRLGFTADYGRYCAIPPHCTVGGTTPCVVERADDCPAGTSAAEASVSDVEINVCRPLIACSSSKYFDADENKCLARSSCEDGQYIATASTTTSDTVCDALTECTVSVTYESKAPTSDSDRECTAVKTCETDEYISTAATLTSDNVCSAISTCTTTEEFEVRPPTDTSDRVCEACADNDCHCGVTQYNDDGTCRPFDAGQCPEGDYEQQLRTETSDRICDALTVCLEKEYESTAPKADADRACTELTECDATNDCEWQNPTATSDRVCQPCHTTRAEICHDNVDYWDQMKKGVLAGKTVITSSNNGNLLVVQDDESGQCSFTAVTSTWQAHSVNLVDELCTPNGGKVFSEDEKWFYFWEEANQRKFYFVSVDALTDDDVDTEAVSSATLDLAAGDEPSNIHSIFGEAALLIPTANGKIYVCTPSASGVWSCPELEYKDNSALQCTGCDYLCAPAGGRAITCFRNDAGGREDDTRWFYWFADGLVADSVSEPSKLIGLLLDNSMSQEDLLSLSVVYAGLDTYLVNALIAPALLVVDSSESVGADRLDIEYIPTSTNVWDIQWPANAFMSRGVLHVYYGTRGYAYKGGEWEHTFSVGLDSGQVHFIGTMSGGEILVVGNFVPGAGTDIPGHNAPNPVHDLVNVNDEEKIAYYALLESGGIRLIPEAPFGNWQELLFSTGSANHTWARTDEDGWGPYERTCRQPRGCYPGTYEGPNQEKGKDTVCLDCPSGTYQPLAGATSVDACYECRPGYVTASAIDYCRLDLKNCSAVKQLCHKYFPSDSDVLVEHWITMFSADLTETDDFLEAFGAGIDLPEGQISGAYDMAVAMGIGCQYGKDDLCQAEGSHSTGTTTPPSTDTPKKKKVSVEVIALSSVLGVVVLLSAAHIIMGTDAFKTCRSGHKSEEKEKLMS